MTKIIEFPIKKIVDFTKVPKMFEKEVMKAIEEDVDTAKISKVKIKKLLKSGNVITTCIEDNEDGVDLSQHKPLDYEGIDMVLTELDIFKKSLCRINIYNPSLVHVRMTSGLSYQIKLI